MSLEDVPGLMPVRMLNEFVFCKRLFYLEWADRQWMSNDDIAEGDWTHRRTDTKRGSVPNSPEAAWPSESYSVRLEDESLGLAAVVDRIDAASGRVSPVDYKKGYPQADGTAWPSDVIQVEAQGALLRAAGHECDEGWLYYAATGRRVRVSLGDASDRRVADVVEDARRVASRGVAPLPLEDSGRCLRCSLAPLCLPDEVNALRGRRANLKRAILPRRPDQRPLHVTVPGARVGIRPGQVVVHVPDGEDVRIRLIDISHLAVFGSVQVSTQALTKLWAAGVPVLWLSHGGWLQGWAAGQPRKNATLKRALAKEGLRHLLLARGLVAGKIRNQRVQLRRNCKDKVDPSVLKSLRDVASRCEDACSTGELMGLEGVAGRQYFQWFGTMLNPGEFRDLYCANGRSRRPAPDPVNAALGFAYSLLVKETVVACLAVGLDPYLGVLHADRFGRPSLALDFMEQFRPLVADSVVIAAFNTGELGVQHFKIRGGICALTPVGRRTLIGAFERRMESEITHPTFGYRVSYRRAVDLQVRLGAALLVGEVDSYPALVTR